MIMLKRELLVTCLLSLLLVSICPNALAQAWRVTGNNGTGCNTTPCANFLGTTDNSSFEIDVNGQRAYRIEPATNSIFGNFSPNIIGGLNGNNVTAGAGGATIGGGGFPGGVNRVTGDFGTVAGGANNQAGDGTASDAAWATVAGGLGNTANGNASTVAGGRANTTSGFYSSVAGGYNNNASAYSSFVGGGNLNTASSNASTVAGGHRNTATSGG